jgi:transposase-like protein
LVHSSDAQWPVPMIARELSVAPDTLSHWGKQAQTDAGEREGLATEEREELRRPRREVRVAQAGDPSYRNPRSAQL